MGYELVEQLRWEYPAAVFYPTGGGVGLIGMWKAFIELEELGWVKPGKRPRMIAVQSSGCALWQRLSTTRESQPSVAKRRDVCVGTTRAEALRRLHHAEILKESGGVALGVSG